MIKAIITKLVFSDETEVDVSKDKVIVFTGPNNSGKSKALKEIRLDSATMTNVPDNVVLKSLASTVVCDDRNELDNLFSYYSVNNNSENVAIKYATPQGQNFYPKDFDSYFKEDIFQEQLFRNNLKQYLIKMLNTKVRLAEAEQKPSIDSLETRIEYPIQFVYKKLELEEKLREKFRNAFRTGIYLNRAGGKVLRFHVGEIPDYNRTNLYSPEIQKKTENLPLLDGQGDGMKSFTSVLLNVMVGIEKILIIDEPEAFLHPPQARLLGRSLAADFTQDRQLFLATHSEDFLQGLLESDIPAIKIIRLKRDGNVNYAKELPSESIKEIWSDPLLRFSKILSGIFYEKVILCEGDSDCKFFSSMASTLIEAKAIERVDYLFTHCGGKPRLPTAIKALKKLDIPLSVVIDIDFFHEVDLAKKIIESLDGDWARVSTSFNMVKSAVEKKRPDLEVGPLKKEIGQILDSVGGASIDEKSIRNIKVALKNSSPWQLFKQSGSSFIPNGQETRAFEEIHAYCASLGLHIIKSGELESFYRKEDGHGPKWVLSVLEKIDLKNDLDLHEAREFVKRLLS